MRTFRRYLLSYLCTLLLPVFILSMVIYEVVTSYCGAQLLEQNLAAMQQLSISVAMQREQLDAYAVQTTNRSEFFYRNQKQPGDFYEIQSILSRWIAGNAFIDDICYYNPKLDKIYAYNAVYSIDSFAQWRIHGLGSDDIRRIVASDGFNLWTSVSAQDRNNLFYFASARVSPEERNWLICKVSNTALNAMIESTKLYSQASTYICSADGTVLYTTENVYPDIHEYLNLKETKGVAKVSGEAMMYTRLEDGDLIFLSIVPEAVAHQSIAKIWQLVYIGLFFILVLGAVVIAWVMRLNYHPIHELESDVLKSTLLTERSSDALQNVRKALQLMQSRHTLAMHRTIILDKERMILRLLMGSYSTVEQFNADGQQAGMQLSDSTWYIVNVQIAPGTPVQENSLEQAVAAIKQMYADRKDLLYLEIPENNQILCIVSGKPQSDEKEIIISSMNDFGFKADILFSAVCAGTKDLSAVWLDMSGKQSRQQQTESVYPQDIYALLLNAVEFGESDRIRFAIEMLIAGVRQSGCIKRIRAVTSDVLNLARSKLLSRDDQQGAAQIDALLKQVPSLHLEDRALAEQILRQLSELLCEQVELVHEDEPVTLIQQIEQYLQEHYCESEFTVQKAAAHFNLSISNLGHYFKSHTGVTVSDYVESLRLNLAQKLLRETDKSVSDISASVGYLQPATFMRAFKKVLGVSPTNWRNEQQKG